MMKFKIKKHPAKPLLLKAEPVDLTESATYYNKLAWRLSQAMMQEEGVGMAAPQLGESIQACWVSGPQYTGLVMNPTITLSGEAHEDVEGCLSIPNKSFQVERSLSVDVTFWTYDFGGLREQTGVYTGYTARIFQHEIDHLNGICIPERLAL